MNAIITDRYIGWEENCPFSKQKSKQMNMAINSYSQRKKIHISQLLYIRLQHYVVNIILFIRIIAVIRIFVVPND